jgi:hypothetical protein
MNYFSNCCGAPVNPDIEICSDCGEHCSAIEETDIDDNSESRYPDQY